MRGVCCCVSLPFWLLCESIILISYAECHAPVLDSFYGVPSWKDLSERPFDSSHASKRYCFDVSLPPTSSITSRGFSYRTELHQVPVVYQGRRFKFVKVQHVV